MSDNFTATKTLDEFKKIINAEDYFQFFDLPYDRHFVNVNRLHILKKFSLFIEEIHEQFPNLTEAEKLAKYQEALSAAYQLFQTASPLETRLFKVLQQRAKNVVLLEDIDFDAEE